jgi:NAD(P)-dependent dehydrogenase (short-subunit alcohol dehydrogenase family)
MATAAVYAATKGALASLVRVLAVELAPRGIRVNSVSPGTIDTPIYDKLGLVDAAKDAMKGRLTARVPLGRIGASDEVARVALFLAAGSSSFVTGADLAVDGGLAAAG